LLWSGNRVTGVAKGILQWIFFSSLQKKDQTAVNMAELAADERRQIPTFATVKMM
jgi:hypothetical protein